ncbi:MAG: exodeoxyribonuclease VII large subunit [Lentisphaeria bacterium]|nr:exodeoxyribonuclease VII large subunit [Lentisphaeria bacterium]
MTEEPVWSVSQVNRAIRDTLEGAFMPFWMSGEVGSILLHRSGHAYFQLKDEHAQIRACWFGGASQCRNMGIDNGSKVEVFGNLSVYEVRGEYQFNIKKLRSAGLGELQRRFEELKQRLAAEGLFDPARKKPIPHLPGRIGVVSSPTGAAIRDFLQILTRRFPNVHVKIYPAQVQGSSAAAEVAAGVRFFNRTGGADVIVVTRGGGSMEDLWCFNEEILAREVAASKIPVISAVGHEIDFTICDFAADLRVPTPSAAAELVIGRHDEIGGRLERLEKDLAYSLQNRLNHLRLRLERSAGSVVFHEPRRLVEMRQQHLDELDIRLVNALKLQYTAKNHRLTQLSDALHTLNPERQLERGYALVFDESNTKLVSSSEMPPETRLNIRFADGSVKVETL